MHWRRLRSCPSPCNPAYAIGRCEGRPIDKGRIIGLDSSNLSKSPKLCLATGLWRIQRWYLAGSGNGPLHRAAARTSSDTVYRHHSPEWHRERERLRRREWREHQWREHEWREHHWRDYP